MQYDYHKQWQVLEEAKPQYIIRADIKSFYKSIPHFKLLQDIKKYYDDPKVQVMLEHIITNPIETSRGYKNPGTGIALRGPLSQFFSGIYLKPLDDAFDDMNVTYLRYQDDIIILCKTKRQMNRCRRRMMEVLHERHLSLSRKKSRMGSINQGFHFLGINYFFPTQTENNTNVTHANDDLMMQNNVVYSLSTCGGNRPSNHQMHESIRIVPHPRTLRKAREQIKSMVIDEVSPLRIRNYLDRWVIWWAMTSRTWQYQEILQRFIEVCWHKKAAAYATALSQLYFKKLRTEFESVGVAA